MAIGDMHKSVLIKNNESFSNRESLWHKILYLAYLVYDILAVVFCVSSCLYVVFMYIYF